MARSVSELENCVESITINQNMNRKWKSLALLHVMTQKFGAIPLWTANAL